MVGKNVKGREEPLYYTKPLRKLTRANSEGYRVIEFSENVLGVKLFPAQKWLLIHALEYKKGSKNYRFSKILFSFARQNGKTTVVACLIMYMLYVKALKATVRPFSVVSAAITTEMAKNCYNMVLRWHTEGTPEYLPATHGSKIMLSNGKEAIITRSDSMFKVSTPQTSIGRSVALLLLDEAKFIQQPDFFIKLMQSLKAVPNSQTWIFSNAGDERGKWFHDAQEDAKQRAEDEDTRTGVFLWEAPEDAPVDDPTTWAYANPALGHTLDVETLREDYATMPLQDFKTEVLNQWSDRPVKGAIDLTKYDAKTSEYAIDETRPMCLGASMSPDWGMTALSLAGYTKNGDVFVESGKLAPGGEWVGAMASRMMKRYPTIESVVLQGRGGASPDLIPLLNAADIPVSPVEGRFIGKAYATYIKAVEDGEFTHTDEEAVRSELARIQLKQLAGVDVFDDRKSRSPTLATSQVFAYYGLVGDDIAKVKKKKTDLGLFEIVGI